MFADASTRITDPADIAEVVSRMESMPMEARRTKARQAVQDLGYGVLDLWNLDTWLARQLASIFASADPASAPEGVCADTLSRLSVAFAAYAATQNIADADLALGLEIFAMLDSADRHPTLTGLASMAALLAPSTVTAPDGDFDGHRARLRHVAELAERVKAEMKTSAVAPATARDLGAALGAVFHSLWD